MGLTVKAFQDQDPVFRDAVRRALIIVEPIIGTADGVGAVVIGIKRRGQEIGVQGGGDNSQYGEQFAANLAKTIIALLQLDVICGQCGQMHGGGVKH